MRAVRNVIFVLADQLSTRLSNLVGADPSGAPS
jgi:hypothetical protein